jgi:hypothetical protein
MVGGLKAALTYKFKKCIYANNSSSPRVHEPDCCVSDGYTHKNNKRE